MTLQKHSTSVAELSELLGQNRTGNGFEVCVEFRVHGIPRPQGSKRMVGHGRMIEASRHVHQWRNDVMSAAAAAFDGAPIEGPVQLEIMFFFPRPKGHYGTGRNAHKLKPSAPELPTSRSYGDTTKLARSTEDAISECSGYPVLKDDSQVTDLICRKRYACDVNSPGALVRVRCRSTLDH